MKAIVQSVYGGPEVLSVAAVETPAPLPQEVLVQVEAAGVHAGDWHLMRGQPWLVRLLFGGLLKPKIRTIGTDMAGVVVAVGADVTEFQPGDAVFGDLSASGFGAWAEYVCVPPTALVQKPSNLNFAQAAAVPVSALAALQGLRDVGQIRAGQSVLINGASGGVGSYAVQIAKAAGAEVTGVCHPTKAAMLHELGIDHVIDYTQTDCARSGQTYDLIFDAAAYRPASDFASALKPQGIYVLVGGDTTRIFQLMLLSGWLSWRYKRQFKFVTSTPNQTDLTTLKQMLEAGQIQPVIDRCYPLTELPKAIQQIEQRQVQGKVVIRVSNA